MSNKNKALSNQSLPDVRPTHDKAVKKLDRALKIVGIALKLIAIVERVIGWLG